ncbi:MAG: IS630 family transposase [Deinococcaceae bacterium]
MKSDLNEIGFLDEFGVHIDCETLYGWSHKKRLYCKINRSKRRKKRNVILILHMKMVCTFIIDGTMNTDVFLKYIEIFCEEIKKIGIRKIVMDNLSVHKTKSVKDLFEENGIEILYIPPYSPELNPIEESISKIKNGIRRYPSKTIDNIENIIQECVEAVTPENIEGYKKHFMPFVNS